MWSNSSFHQTYHVTNLSWCHNHFMICDEISSSTYTKWTVTGYLHICLQELLLETMPRGSRWTVFVLMLMSEGVIELPQHLCPLSAQHTATLPCNLMWSHTDTHKGTYFCTKNSISSLKQQILSQMFVKTAVWVGAWVTSVTVGSKTPDFKD